MNPLARWFRTNPLAIALVGIAIGAIGLVRSQPLAIGLRVVILALGLVRIIA